MRKKVILSLALKLKVQFCGGNKVVSGGVGFRFGVHRFQRATGVAEGWSLISHDDLAVGKGPSPNNTYVTVVLKTCSSYGPGSALAFGWGIQSTSSPDQLDKWHGNVQNPPPSPISVSSNVTVIFKYFQKIFLLGVENNSAWLHHRHLFTYSSWVWTHISNKYSVRSCVYKQIWKTDLISSMGGQAHLGIEISQAFPSAVKQIEFEQIPVKKHSISLMVMFFHTWKGKSLPTWLILVYRKQQTGRTKFFQKTQCICFLCSALNLLWLTKGQFVL